MLNNFFGLDVSKRSVILAGILLFRSGGCGRVGKGGVEKSRLQLTSAKVEVEVEAEINNIQIGLVWFTLSITTYPGGWVGGWVGGVC